MIDCGAWKHRFPACLPADRHGPAPAVLLRASSSNPTQETNNEPSPCNASNAVRVSLSRDQTTRRWVGGSSSERGMCRRRDHSPFFLLLMLTASSGSSDLLLAEPELEAAAAASSGNRSRERGGWSEERENSTCVPLEISTVSGPERQHS